MLALALPQLPLIWALESPRSLKSPGCGVWMLVPACLLGSVRGTFQMSFGTEAPGASLKASLSEPLPFSLNVHTCSVQRCVGSSHPRFVCLSSICSPASHPDTYLSPNIRLQRAIRSSPCTGGGGSSRWGQTPLSSSDLRESPIIILQYVL